MGCLISKVAGLKADAAVHPTTALHALLVRAKDTFAQSINTLGKLIDHLKPWAKTTLAWVKEHPWETAAIVITIVLVASTPAILGAAGFTAGGIAAGSVAAGIQSGIGNVVAGSTFAILTSAGMGGFGLPIVLGSVGVVAGTSLLDIAKLIRRCCGAENGGDDNDEGDVGGKLKLL